MEKYNKPRAQRFPPTSTCVVASIFIQIHRKKRPASRSQGAERVGVRATLRILLFFSAVEAESGAVAEGCRRRCAPLAPAHLPGYPLFIVRVDASAPSLLSLNVRAYL